MIRTSRPFLPLTVLVALLTLLGTAGGQQEAEKAGEAPADSVSVQDLLERITKLEKEVERLKGNAPVPAGNDRPVHALLETPHIGQIYDGGGPNRFFAARLLFLNLGNEPLTVERETIELNVDGNSRQLQDIPARIQNFRVQVGTQALDLRKLEMPKQVQIPAGGMGSTWVFFPKIAEGNGIPRLRLSFRAGEIRTELNVNELQQAVLGLEVERIGPQDSLALLTISGSLNAINAGTLIDEFDRLAGKNVARAVIRFTETAPPPDPQMLSWLQQSALQAGQGQFNHPLLPAVPVSIKELHLVHEQSASAQAQRGNGPIRLHKTATAAVGAALASAYEMLPRDQLIREIEKGHPLTRAAAITHGGGRLGPDKLPILLAFADDDDPQIQQAALTALRHFGDSRAVDKLLEYARKNVEDITETAIDSLAGSRFSAAHEALLELLENEPPEEKKKIVQVLAANPRPAWSATIYEYVRDTRAGLNLEALRALVQVGHPELIDVLEEALGSKEKELRELAFSVLVAQTDARSEQIATEHTLKRLESEPPDAYMVTLLSRTKDQRAVPLLVKHLDQPTNRANVINLLSQIGDQRVGEVLVEKYPSLQGHEKPPVLNALRRLRSPKFRSLAGEALLQADSTLANAAVQGLQADGTPEATALLSEGLEKSANVSTWSYICNALGTLATPEARLALMKARESDNQHKQTYARNALENIYRRSPGYQYVYQANELAQQHKWQEAADQFALALEVDPDLPDAYSGRGNMLLKLEKLEQAQQDFEKAVELDPYDSIALTGLAIVWAMNGKYEEAIRKVEEARERFSKDPNEAAVFAYNTACVYGRALDHLNKHKETEGRDEKVAEYTKKAIAELKRAINLGFRELDWMQEDPDLVPLHGHEEFRKLGGAAEEAPDAPEDNDAPPKAAEAGDDLEAE